MPVVGFQVQKPPTNPIRVLFWGGMQALAFRLKPAVLSGLGCGLHGGGLTTGSTRGGTHVGWGSVIPRGPWGRTPGQVLHPAVRGWRVNGFGQLWFRTVSVSVLRHTAPVSAGRGGRGARWDVTDTCH